MITLQEIRDKFNLHYNNVLSGGAPGLDDYELSLFLTQAYKEVIFNLYNGTSKGESFDYTEKLKALLSTSTITSVFTEGNLLPALTEDLISKKFELSSDVWFIVKESVDMGNGYKKVIPIAHNEFWVLAGNPYKAPNKLRAWRLDEGDLLTGIRNVIIISAFPVDSYQCTYIAKPGPIILSDLTLIADDLHIENLTENTLPKIIENNVWLAELIINRAVELATKDYKENSLNNQVSLNTRIE